MTGPRKRQTPVEPRIPEGAKPITARARPTRAEVTGHERRRRRAGTLNRMAQYTLDIFEEGQLDPNYVYRWIADTGSRLRQVTRGDDYDFVNASEIKDFSAEDSTDSEGAERIRMLTGKDKHGNPEYCYLLKKRRDFWEDDNRAGMDFRDDMLAGRVYRGEGDVEARTVTAEGVKSVSPKEVDTSEFYVPPEATLGSVGRRRGPVQPQG